MSKKRNFAKDIYSTGPLSKAASRVEDFGHNLYFSYIFHESVVTHQRLEDEYIEAFLDSDEARMRTLSAEIKVVENAFEAVAHSMGIDEADIWSGSNND